MKQNLIDIFQLPQIPIIAQSLELVPRIQFKIIKIEYEHIIISSMLNKIQHIQRSIETIKLQNCNQMAEFGQKDYIPKYLRNLNNKIQNVLSHHILIARQNLGLLICNFTEFLSPKIHLIHN